MTESNKSRQPCGAVSQSESSKGGERCGFFIDGLRDCVRKHAWSAACHNSRDCRGEIVNSLYRCVQVKEVVLSKFTETMFRNAREPLKGIVTGEPDSAVRQTWSEIHQKARCIAGGLAAAGFGSGDVAAVLVQDPAEIASTVQAVWMRGACFTMLHPPGVRSPRAVWASESSGAIRTINASAIIISEPFEDCRSIVEEWGTVKVLTVAELLASVPVEPVDTEEGDLALIQLTSGSTGISKAVRITHHNMRSNLEAMCTASEYDSVNDVMVSWLPCFQDMGLIGFLTLPMYFGGELVKVTPADFLRDVMLWAKLIDKYKGTMTAAPNFAYALFAKRLGEQSVPGEFDLSTLRFALSGGEPVEPADVERLIEVGAPFRLRPDAFVPAYGMAEAAVAVAFSELGMGLIVDEVDAELLGSLNRAVPATEGKTRRLTCLGRPLEGFEVRIVNGQGNVLPPRGVGVIQLRGHSMTPGYSRADGFIAAADEDGWYHTGDMGYLVENGQIVVCGRVNDVITVSNKTIYPTAIERAANQVDGVRPGCSAAVRLNAGHLWENFAVAVESAAHRQPSEVQRIKSEVLDAVVSEVDVPPRNVVVLAPGSVPKTPSGKVRRSATAKLLSC